MSDSITIDGTIIAVLPVQQVGEKWEKQEVVIKTDEKYPQEIKVEYFGDNMEEIAGVEVGDYVQAHVNLRGRPWKDTWFNTISGWKMRVVTAGSPAPSEHQQQKQDGYQQDRSVANDAPEDDIPF